VNVAARFQFWDADDQNGDLGHTQASNQRSLNLLPRKGRQYCSLVIYHMLFLGDLSYVDVHPFHDYEKWDTFGRFIEKSSAYKPWIYLLEFEIELLVLKKLHVGLSPLHSMTVVHDEIEKRKERAELKSNVADARMKEVECQHFCCRYVLDAKCSR
ncbi:purple acid phosphatase 5-like protein, partial [Tanacetum coccineum]